MYFVGIDISKFKHDCTIVDELGDVSSHKLLNSLLQRPPGRVTIVQISKEVCAMVYFCICIGILFFALLFRLASTLRLTIPLLYALIVPTLFSSWYHAHQPLADGIWYGLLAMVALSWLVTIIRRLRA